MARSVFWPCIASAAAGAAVSAAGFAFNPTADQHRAKIRAAIIEQSPVVGALGLGALAAFNSTYHSLGVASYATANGNLVTVGALGVVVVVQPPTRR